MPYRILITDALAPQALERFCRFAGLQVDVQLGLTPEKLLSVIPPYHGLIIRSGTKVTPAVIDAAVNLRVIGRAGIGVENIAVGDATKHGIVVMNTPGGNNITTAEHALCLLLALARNIPQANMSLKGGRWQREKFVGSEVCNKVLGVIGLGNIGAIVADRAAGLGMWVVAYDPFVGRETAAKRGVELVSLGELYSQADFITVHTPLTQETQGLIDAAAFAKMKRGVRIINCARGGIVDEDALLQAVLSGQVAGAALDVFVEEPPPATHPLLQLDQVICTPHLGAATEEAQINVAVAIADQVASFLTRGVIQNAIEQNRGDVPSPTPLQAETRQPYLAAQM